MKWKHVLLVVVSVGFFAGQARSDSIVYSNDFETNVVGTASGITTSGFTTAGTLSAKTPTSATLNLHAPSSGTANNTKWLGMYNTGTSGATVALGRNVAKVVASPTAGADPAKNEIARLTLSNLTVGTTYSVQFDLMIGESWDGSAGGSIGRDFWSFSANGTRLVNTIFSNVTNGALGTPQDPYHNAGANSPQKYTDANYNPANPLLAPDVKRFTGADTLYYGATPNSSIYGDLYAIYYFGHGTGNPMLSFTATSSTATLEWARYSGTTDSADESWALDNVMVTAPVVVVPLPPTVAAGVAGMFAVAAWRGANTLKNRVARGSVC